MFARNCRSIRKVSLHYDLSLNDIAYSHSLFPPRLYLSSVIAAVIAPQLSAKRSRLITTSSLETDPYVAPVVYRGDIKVHTIVFSLSHQQY